MRNHPGERLAAGPVGDARSHGASLDSSHFADRRLCGVLNAGAPGHRSNAGSVSPAASCCDSRSRSWTAEVRWSWAGAANCSSLGSVITVDPLVGIRGAVLGSAVVVSAPRADGGVEAFPSQSCRALTLLSPSEVLLHIALVQLPFERLSEAPLLLTQAPAHNPTHSVDEARNRTISGHTPPKDTLRRN